MSEDGPYNRDGETVDVFDNRLDVVESDEFDGPKYQSQEWLYQQYAVLGKTQDEIADTCGVSPKTIWRWIKEHEIGTRSGGPRSGPWKHEEWLRGQYSDRQKSIYQIADEQDCDEKTIRNWLAEHEIETRGPSERHPASRKERPYRDEQWLRNQYEEQGKSADVIADSVGVSPATIRRWVEHHEIEKRTMAESRRRTEARASRVPQEEDRNEAAESGMIERASGHRSYRGPETGLDVSYTSNLGEMSAGRLESPYRDEEWLRNQYERQGSVKAIAELCNVTPRTITYWMEKHEVDRQRGNDDAPYRDEEWLREQYGELGSARAIAAKCDVTPGAILHWMDEFDVERLGPGEAGAKARWENADRLTYETFLDALIAMNGEQGEWPNVQQYSRDHPPWGPSKSTVYQMDGFSGWTEAVEDAKQRTR